MRGWHTGYVNMCSALYGDRKSMDFFKKTKGLVIFLVFFIISSTNASLTFDVNVNQSAFLSKSNHISVGKYNQNRQEKEYLEKFYIYQFNGLKNKYNSNYVNSCIQTESGFHSKPLPAGPKALLMVIASFVCISLIRDRRFWIKVMVGLFGAGQIGLSILPRVVSNLSYKKNNEQYRSFNYDKYSEAIKEGLKRNLDDTRYIGLLRLLSGIPGSAVSFPLPYYLFKKIDVQDVADKSNRYTYQNSASKNSITLIRRIIVDFQSIFEHSIQYAQYYYLNIINDWYIYLSVSIDFVQLARGPPNIQMRS